MDQPTFDPVEDKRLELEQLVLEKKRLLQEVECMQIQQKAYEENKPFFDKLIALHSKLEEMQRLKETIIDKSATLAQLDEVLANSLAVVENQVNNKDKIQQQLEDILSEVQSIIQACSK